MEAIRSLYVHIPFCERKCEYCDFTSIAGLRGKDGYIDALCAELDLLAGAFPQTVLDTVFIGGGTPSLVEPGEIAEVMEHVAGGFALSHDAEVTMEANPSSTDAARARTWRASGINRVSIGVQSLHPPTLRYLGRVHDAERALRAVDEVRRSGIERVSCDLIYAVPGLDDDSWFDTLRRTVAAGPGHISCYELTVETGTPLHTRVRRGLTRPVDDDTALRQHQVAVDVLAAAGLEQYEVSNFARPGLRCRHNLNYWRNGHYLAAGVGAHGHVPAAAAAPLGAAPDAGAVSVRYWHGKGIAAYTERALRGELPVQGWEAIDAPTAEVERLMLGLRLHDGVALHPGNEARALAAGGLLELLPGRVRVTRRGESVLNSVVERLSSSEGAELACYA